MAILIGTPSGARLVLDTAGDSPGDKVASLARRYSSPRSWTPSAGEVIRVLDLGDSTEVEVVVPGPFAGQVDLSSQGVVLLTSPQISLSLGEKASLRFRLGYAGLREATLTGS